MHRVLAETGAVLLELQLFAAHLATERVVMVACFLADEEHGFDFLFSFSSSHGSEGSEVRRQRSEEPLAVHRYGLAPVRDAEPLIVRQWREMLQWG